jgi:hypothetical protein
VLHRAENRTFVLAPIHKGAISGRHCMRHPTLEAAFQRRPLTGASSSSEKPPLEGFAIVAGAAGVL